MDGYSTAFANRSEFPMDATCQTSAATSSPAYLLATASTSVITCDAYHMVNGNFTPIALDSGVLLMQFKSASTTGATLTAKFQYSNDGVDWYGDNTGQNNIATTTGPVTIGADKSITWTAATTSATSSEAIDIKTPTRFIRVTFTNPAGLATSSIWGQFIFKQQQY